jgi:processive 1,2-diacylglycerol beta-glucosyltransferase
MTRSGVLIVSASTGTGHHRAAEALRQALLARDPATRVEHIDLLKIAPRWVRATYGSGYELIATRAPWLWEQMYRYSDGDDHDRARWSPLARRLMFREFRNILLSHPWQLCLCTHFLPCQLAAGRPGFPPFALAITDFTVHRFWVQPGVARYFVATDAMAAELRARVPSARVTASGIPIAPVFAAAPSRPEARHELGLDPRRPVVIVMGGGLGLGVAEMSRATLAARNQAIQVIALCGRNEDAKAELEALRLPRERLRVEAYVTGVDRYIAAADLVVTKPGGLTASEALAVGRPLLLARAIPGQETGNARALAAAGAALTASSPEELRDGVDRIFSDDALLRGLAAGALRVGRPHSAETIVREVMQEVALGQLASVHPRGTDPNTRIAS